ncbi:DUF3325 domain-containing protein [Pseudoalteromonas sp. Scap03]|uniref:DUF3325 domain-containing protein n=1 Tax=unclassified Pseudoalteromonas TaxID=194690 RepID=UPI0015BEEE0C|nr:MULTISPECIES: DUF3325 domain-containing protein [unclassified Pseudoalteromonas]NWL17170.1 DUF3325 domain-containing protein [Pseudoalteromonas sp. Scap03]QLE83215.1 DUF3325 domain-containing protein [Pseudoalteromonas sp. Scap25]QLE91157.1 DUF3325 domain-containing protein [Pseudoalteromonas sp. Scap06]
MIALLPFSLCLLAFNCFALAKFNHFKDVFNKRPTQQQRLVLLSVAWISILLSLLLCVNELKGYGGLQFCGYMTLSALIVMIFYSFLVRLTKLFNLLILVILAMSTLFFGLNGL